MSETLIIAGVTFESAAGFKAVDSSLVAQTYIKPEGMAQISISSNGITTEDITAYASAQISVVVPNTYSAGDEGKVVNNGVLVSQSSATYTSNNTYDTTLVNSVTINVSGGGGEPTYFDRHGIMYKENMVIPEKDSTDTTISTPRYVRDAFEGATYLKSYIQQYGTPTTDSDYGLFRNCTNLETVWVARATFGGYCFAQCSKLKHVTLGRIGLAVTSLTNGQFNSSYIQAIEDITVYVNASDLAGVPSAVKDRIIPSYSHGAVITYKNYSSGETIATVTVP